MAGSRMPMTKGQKNALTRSRSFLVQNLTLENIRNGLIAREVFTDDMLEEIETKKTPMLRKQALLSDLGRRPRDCYENFITVLEENGETHCAAELRRNEQPTGSPEQSHQPPCSQHPPPAPAPARQSVQETGGGSGPGELAMGTLSRTAASSAGCRPQSSTAAPGLADFHVEEEQRDAARQQHGPPFQGQQAPNPEQMSKYHEKREMDPDAVYKHESSPRGRALIINNAKFANEEERRGSDRDRDRLKDLLRGLDMEVDICNNLTAEAMKNEIRRFARNPKLADVHSCVLVVMSHGGDKGKIYGSDSQGVTDDEIKEMFNRDNCPNMGGKPKLMIFQACRGGKEDRPASASGGGSVPSSATKGDAVMTEDDDETSRSITVENPHPNMADFLVVYSTCKDYVAYRHEQTGSLFIQKLVEEFKKHAHSEHVLDMVTRANSLLTEEVHKHDRSICSTSSLESTLRRQFFLNPPSS